MQSQKKKAVLFNYWGVTVACSPSHVLKKLEELHNLPGGLLTSVATQQSGAIAQAERGEVTLSEMVPLLEAECLKEAQTRGLTLPPEWSALAVVEKLREAMMNVQPAALKVSAKLRDDGFLTAVLANHWLDDTDSSSFHLCLLGGYFDLVHQSCRSQGHRVPEAAMFKSALELLGVEPQQALWLDADEGGVKAAEGAGIKAVLVTNLEEVLEKVSSFTGIQAATAANTPPPHCRPDEVSHGYITIKPGVTTHYVEMGTGPPVLLCHGFPESWYSWRYQIPALAAAGFRVLAADMKGYGESTAPADIEEYSQMQLCMDIVTFLDRMCIPKVTLVGHDWGGALVWNMAQYFPERVSAVASLNTPLIRYDPAGFAKLKAMPIFDYQIYFQKPGVAEAELEKNLERTFKLVFQRANEGPEISSAGVCARGGLLVGAPDEVPRSSMLSKADLQYYVSRYEKSGFRGPLNWYRNMDRNEKWQSLRPNPKVLLPALMLTAGKDGVLLPALTKGMEDLVPNLKRGHIEDCGHWTQMDRPAETNKILVSWLQEVHAKAGGGVTAKL